MCYSQNKCFLYHFWVYLFHIRSFFVFYFYVIHQKHFFVVFFEKKHKKSFYFFSVNNSTNNIISDYYFTNKTIKYLLYVIYILNQ